MLAPKLLLTPLLVSSASLAGRRYGSLLSGWSIALPLTLLPMLDIARRGAARSGTPIGPWT